jgi:hypothetical protein
MAQWSLEMSNLTRLLREQAGQMIGVCVTLLERIVLTGVLYRTLGARRLRKVVSLHRTRWLHKRIRIRI